MAEQQTDSRKKKNTAVYKIEVTGGKDPRSSYVETSGKDISKRRPDGSYSHEHRSFASCFTEALPAECSRVNIYECRVSSAIGSMNLIASASYDRGLIFGPTCPGMIKRLCEKKKMTFVKPEKKVKKEETLGWPYLSNESSPLY